MSGLFRKVRSVKPDDEAPMPLSLETIQKETRPCQPGHPFVIAKGLGANLANIEHEVYTGIAEINGVQCHGALALKVFNAEGKLVNYQFTARIDDGRYAEVFALNEDIGGCFARIGKPKKAILVAHNWASGISLHLATDHAVAVAFNVENLGPVCKKLADYYPDTQIIVCAADDGYSRDSMLDLASTAAGTIGALVALPQFASNRPDSLLDFNDLRRLEGKEAVRRCVQSASDPTSSNGLIALIKEVKRLADFGPVEYEQQRTRSAKALGVRTNFIDDSVKKLRARQCANEDNSSSPRHEKVTPCPHPVDGEAMADEISQTITHFTVMSPAAVDAVTLWIISTYVVHMMQIFPILALESPVKRCGKTTVLGQINLLASRPITASNITPAALFRTVETMAPTLLIDEADTFIHKSEELTGIINSGHTRSNAYVIRVEDGIPRQFSTWCPKAIALIGTPPETIRDRSIVIPLRRKTADEHVESLRLAPPTKFSNLKSKIMRWAIDNATQLSTQKLPHLSLANDRAQDNWEPLLIVARCLGGKWLDRAMVAAADLSSAHDEDGSIDEELLSDIWHIFESQATEKIKTSALIAALCADEEKPWKTFARGRPMSSRDLSSLLKKFGIHSKNLRHGQGVAKGYEIRQFEDAFVRYLPKRME